jgi:hypothetical protein
MRCSDVYYGGESAMVQLDDQGSGSVRVQARDSLTV